MHLHIHKNVFKESVYGNYISFRHRLEVIQNNLLNIQIDISYKIENFFSQKEGLCTIKAKFFEMIHQILQ